MRHQPLPTLSSAPTLIREGPPHTWQRNGITVRQYTYRAPNGQRVVAMIKDAPGRDGPVSLRVVEHCTHSAAEDSSCRQCRQQLDRGMRRFLHTRHCVLLQVPPARTPDENHARAEAVARVLKELGSQRVVWYGPEDLRNCLNRADLLQLCRPPASAPPWVKTAHSRRIS